MTEFIEINFPSKTKKSEQKTLNGAKVSKQGKTKKSSNKARTTEVDAYAYIKRELEQLGWDARNPAKVAQGQVYTQNQCLSDPEIRKWLDKKKPESISESKRECFVGNRSQKRTNRHYSGT